MQSPMWAPGLHRSHPLANGLVGLWPMWDGDGDKAMDLVAGRTGTLTNGPIWVATEEGGALEFDDTTTNHLVLPDTVRGVTHLSLSAYLYIDNTASDNDLWVKGDHGGNQPLVIWYDNSTTDKWMFLVTDTGNDYSGVLTSAAAAPSNEWIHFCWTFEPGQARLFVNAVEDANSPFALVGIDDIKDAATAYTFGWNGKGNTTQTLHVPRELRAEVAAWISEWRKLKSLIEKMGAAQKQFLKTRRKSIRRSSKRS